MTFGGEVGIRITTFYWVCATPALKTTAASAIPKKPY